MNTNKNILKDFIEEEEENKDEGNPETDQMPKFKSIWKTTSLQGLFFI